tara:strand:+ start:1107 stop:1376 length:270 start_codon:yes stop_codon:yes gene_type:complete
MTIDLNQLKDVLERAISTYVQSVVGLIAASGMTDLDLSTIKVMAVSAAPAALSILKGYVASVLPLGDKSASILAMGRPAGSEAESGMYD